MPRINYNVSLEYNGTTSPVGLRDLIKNVIMSQIDGVSFVETNSVQCEYIPPNTVLLKVVLRNGDATMTIPFSLASDVPTADEILTQMRDALIRLPGYNVVESFTEIDREEFDSMIENIDMRDPRYYNSLPTGQTKYFKVMLTDGSSTILSTKYIFGNLVTRFKNYAVSLGKAASADDISEIVEITKDAYFLIKLNAISVLSTPKTYHISFRYNGEVVEREFKTKFEFESFVSVFEHAVRKERIPSTAELISVSESGSTNVGSQRSGYYDNGDGDVEDDNES